MSQVAELLNSAPGLTGVRMHKFVIEREVPAIGAAEPEEMRAVAQRANEVIAGFHLPALWFRTRALWRRGEIAQARPTGR